MIASDGRRSEVWRAWTGGKKPTDEFYVAPRAEGGAGVKVSIHSDGYRQHGPTESLRSQLRDGDMYALDRWCRGDAPRVSEGIRYEYFVEFPSQDLTHFVDDSGLEGAVPIEAADSDKATCVAIFVADPGSDVAELEAMSFASLGRRSGGGVYLVALHVPYWPIVIPHRPTFVWQMTPYDGSPSHRFVFFTGPSPGKPRGAVDLAADLHPDLLGAPAIPPFNGEVRPWDQVSVQISYKGHLCGLLRCAPGEQAALFIDTASRCNAAQLAQDANMLVEAWHRGDTDADWDRQPDGSWTTGLRGTGHGAHQP